LVDCPVYEAEDFTKLDYPYLACPIGRPGFSNAMDSINSPQKEEEKIMSEKNSAEKMIDELSAERAAYLSSPSSGHPDSEWRRSKGFVDPPMENAITEGTAHLGDISTVTVEILLPILMPSLASSEPLKAIQAALAAGSTVRIVGIQSNGVKMDTLMKGGVDKDGNPVFGVGPRTMNEMVMQAWVTK
jgi:hypothetical protein